MRGRPSRRCSRAEACRSGSDSTQPGGTPGAGGCYAGCSSLARPWGALGVIRKFFRIVEGCGAAHSRTDQYALTELDPAVNLHPLDSHRTHGEALPCALREEHFDTIRENLDRLTVEQVSVEEFVERSGRGRSIASTSATSSSTFRSTTTTVCSHRLCARAAKARLGAWNLLAPDDVLTTCR